jgi:hypothetical protein
VVLIFFLAALARLWRFGAGGAAQFLTRDGFGFGEIKSCTRIEHSWTWEKCTEAVLYGCLL